MASAARRTASGSAGSRARKPPSKQSRSAEKDRPIAWSRSASAKAGRRQRPGALGEQRGGHRGDALLPRRVQRRAAPPGPGDGDHRDGVVLDQPGADAAGLDDADRQGEALANRSCRLLRQQPAGGGGRGAAEHRARRLRHLRERHLAQARAARTPRSRSAGRWRARRPASAARCRSRRARAARRRSSAGRSARAPLPSGPSCRRRDTASSSAASSRSGATPGRERGGQGEGSGARRLGVEGAAGAGGEAGLHQRLVQPAALPAAEQMGHHLQRPGLPRVAPGQAGRDGGAHEGRLAHRRVAARDARFGRGRARRAATLAPTVRAGGDGRVELVREAPDTRLPARRRRPPARRSRGRSGRGRSRAGRRG